MSVWALKNPVNRRRPQKSPRRPRPRRLINRLAPSASPARPSRPRSTPPPPGSGGADLGCQTRREARARGSGGPSPYGRANRERNPPLTDLTITEASEKAGVDRSVIEDAMKSGALPNHRRDDWIRVVTPEHLAGWLEWMRESTQTASDGPHESAGMNVSTDIEKPATGRLYAPMTAGTEIATIEPAGALIAVSDQPRLGIGEAGEITVSDRGTLKEAIGTTSDDFATSLLWDIGSVDFNEPRANQRLALALSFNPRNGPEALLALQAAILHASMVNVAKRLTRGGGDGVTDRIVKLSRAFDSKIDALKRLRAPASQNVVVEHQYINVGAGGQAIVGDVTRTTNEWGPNEWGGGVALFEPRAQAAARSAIRTPPGSTAARPNPSNAKRFPRHRRQPKRAKNDPSPRRIRQCPPRTALPRRQEGGTISPSRRHAQRLSSRIHRPRRPATLAAERPRPEPRQRSDDRLAE